MITVVVPLSAFLRFIAGLFFNLDVDPHLARWTAAFLTNRSQRVRRIGNSLSSLIGLNGERAPVRFVPKTKRFADFCKKYQDQL